MRHRISPHTGLGNPSPIILDNRGHLKKKYADFMLDGYFKEHGGYDFKVTREFVDVGIEPSYQYDQLFIIRIHKNKKLSFIQRGKAWGLYGSQIVQRKKYYSEYKYKSKFTKMVDEFHGVLFK